jgi:light-regulated signal transduction histidine kinase (bacteriophytochrome)
VGFLCPRNGRGFDPEHRKRIFVMFERVHTRDGIIGNSIGLALCKKIIERHGGRIWAESQAGLGSCFSFAIPAILDGDPVVSEFDNCTLESRTETEPVQDKQCSKF